MQFLSALASITLLVSFPLTLHAQNVPNDYIIKEYTDPSKPYLQVLDAKAKVAYTFEKAYNFPSQFKNTVTIADPSLKPIFSMVSSDDQCRLKTHYAQLGGPAAKDNLPKREYKYDNSRAFGKILWRFNFYSDGAGAREYYKFERNRTNKGGRIYKVAAGQPSQLVGLLRFQVRRDNWVGPDTVNGIKTFTLSCIDGAPLPELVTLLGMVFYRC
ncbi:hypothetical protein PGT21_016380 [Puccinia graminis f. sp. tritici]|uniref:Uncharacterized protein n=1 Tax=Puccinia graminis f. sp. tritici TaxID=56615 RepID=A0A5B0MJ95_PUCGR|nr:hypothetical protein PGT21_016380 [Puccinia graminis f. sp. tritici]KAA1126865.1 hypothetical protein PGTUg99_029080 [Puccinia graminis f. sp. tritici]